MSLDREDPPQRISIRVRKPRGPEQEQEIDVADVEASPSDPREDDKVGYKRPPRASRFKPGQSGNPKGRPKGSKNWSTVIDEAATRARTIKVNGKKVRMNALEAVAEQVTIGAIKGDARARRDFLNEMRQGRQAAAETPSDKPGQEGLGPSDEALLADFYRRSARPPDDEGGA